MPWKRVTLDRQLFYALEQVKHRVFPQRDVNLKNTPIAIPNSGYQPERLLERADGPKTERISAGIVEKYIILTAVQTVSPDVRYDADSCRLPCSTSVTVLCCSEWETFRLEKKRE